MIFVCKNIYNIYANIPRKDLIKLEEIDSILNEANRCLNCKTPMCKKGCPIETCIPEFISKIKENKFIEAYFILQENNPMSEICSTICPVEEQCVGHCIRGLKGTPIKINSLEKFVNIWAKENNVSYEIKKVQNINKKVAIIGAGPAGIACAIDLAKNGASVTIFEKESSLGGILEYGIPDFRLQKSILSKIANVMKGLGITIKTNITFGKDITLENLKEQGYSSVFLAMGAQKQTSYKLAEENVESVFNSDEFLKDYNLNHKKRNLGKVVVIGGGNVAIDSARSAIRMGADEVSIVYRRNRELMPAREIEVQEALEDGIKIIYQTRVLSANVLNNKLKSLNCIKTEILNSKAVDIENSEHKIDADTVVFAIGAKPDNKLITALNIKMENGLIAVDENYMTNIDNIYAGGDLVETKSSVCRAIATGKKVAKAIINRKESDK